ncbi:MAG: cobalamin-independent methionine synthase II family protein [Solirubrobacterales bacterium]|nr:cobalamin-independent methionine synthase II family protein [Solirubrobacterales bacterium]MBV9714696.1 cobalamin-independent methionine synthase II family protein [Solirubrobacterales bacterium]
MFRAEVVGSLLRPSYLKEARAALEAGRMPLSEFKRVEDRAVDQAVALQEGAGLDVVTDGEMRRFLFMGPITETVSGIEPVEHGNAMPWATPEGETEWVFPAAVTSKLRRQRSLVSEEYSYARARARVPLKVTVPSPLVLYGLWNPSYSRGAYSDAFAMFADAAEVGRSEIRELVSLGCTYIQVDAPELATLVDPRIRAWTESLGMPAERMLTEGIELINGMVKDISGVRLAIHLCRGNNVGMWMASGGYDYIAGALFQRATAFDAFLLEYDDARSGSFEPLGQAPDDKQVVLGLVSTKSGREETREELAGRIDEAARFFPREQLALSTQCGFASVALGNPIGEAAQERKLQLIAEVARASWR